MRYAYTRLWAQFGVGISRAGKVLEVASVVMALACVVVILLRTGYNLQPAGERASMAVLRACQCVFAVNILFQWVFLRKQNSRYARWMKWVADGCVLLTLVPLLLPHHSHAGWPWLVHLLCSPGFSQLLLGVYSLVEISYALSCVAGRHTNPSLIMGVTFLFFIICGSLVLMLPKFTYGGIAYIDSLFVSASAVCITGLSTVDIPSTFTPRGIVALAVLVQLGGLGVITFTSFFALFFTGNTSIYNQLLIKDMVYSKSMNALVPTLLYVLGFTVTVEAIGAVAVYLTVPAELGLDWEQKAMFAAFHSMSSFCNAGFSTLPGGMSNPVLMAQSRSIYVITSALIFAGAVGFPILVNMKEILHNYALRLLRRHRKGQSPVHIYDLNTKMVLTVTLSVLAIGAVGFFVLEYDNTLRGMSLTDKAVQSLFNALTPRSAGFASVSPSAFLDATLVLVVAQMIVGGASQSMAGGIKVNTLGTMALAVRSVIHGHDGVEAFGRRLNPASVRRAFAVLSLAFGGLLVYTVALMVLEPGLPAKALGFEAVSAFFTVGSSLGITDQLSAASKGLLCTAMFIGRVGIVSLLCGIIGSKPDLSPHLPEDNVIIN